MFRFVKHWNFRDVTLTSVLRYDVLRRNSCTEAR